jgi:hypothetical protein
MIKKAKSRPKGGKMSQLGGNYSNCKGAFSICGRKKAKKKALIKAKDAAAEAERRSKDADAADPPWNWGVWDKKRGCCMSIYRPSPCQNIEGFHGTEICDDSCNSQFFMNSQISGKSSALSDKCKNIKDCGDWRGCPRRNDEAKSLEDD